MTTDMTTETLLQKDPMARKNFVRLRCVAPVFWAILLVCGWGWSVVEATAQTKEIQFPEEELAAQSVLPVFNQRKAVRQRNILLTERFEVGLFGGAVLNEPFFSPFNFGGYFTYHFDELHGLNVTLNNWLDGDTSFKNQLESQGLLNLEGAPALDLMALVSYEYTAWYGKISLSKQTVSNLHLYLLGGGGLVSIGGQINPALSIGIGQKFYISQNWALRFDLRGLVYTGPNPVSVTIPVGGPVPDVSEFKKRVFTNTLLTVGFIVLI